MCHVVGACTRIHLGVTLRAVDDLDHNYAIYRRRLIPEMYCIEPPNYFVLKAAN